MSARNSFVIKKLEAWPLALPLDAPFVVATGAMAVARNIFVRVTLENGAYGYGEMAPFPDISGEDQEGALRTFPLAAKECLGQSALRFRAIAQRLQESASLAPALRCGIETALLDALCRGLGIPLWGLWGGRDVRAQETDMTLPIGPLDQVVATARAWHERGFRLLKMKIGHEVDVDIRRVEAVYRACPDTAFILDANQGFSYEQACECMLAIERLHLPVLVFEQPVAREDVEGFQGLRRRGTMAIAADESVRSLADARYLIERNAVDVVNVKIMKCGVVESLDIACLTRASGIRLMIGGMVESRVAMGCSWSMVLGMGGFDFLDLDTPLLLSGDPVEGGYVYEGPVLQPWEESGLGMEMRNAPSSIFVVG
jgi:L-alanine-DL-glutamate epimerase-like enolase superfamily enzyme